MASRKNMMLLLVFKIVLAFRLEADANGGTLYFSKSQKFSKDPGDAIDFSPIPIQDDKENRMILATKEGKVLQMTGSQATLVNMKNDDIKSTSFEGATEVVLKEKDIKRLGLKLVMVDKQRHKIQNEAGQCHRIDSDGKSTIGDCNKSSDIFLNTSGATNAKNSVNDRIIHISKVAAVDDETKAEPIILIEKDKEGKDKAYEVIADEDGKNVDIYNLSKHQDKVVEEARKKIRAPKHKLENFDILDSESSDSSVVDNYNPPRKNRSTKVNLSPLEIRKIKRMLKRNSKKVSAGQASQPEIEEDVNFESKWHESVPAAQNNHQQAQSAPQHYKNLVPISNPQVESNQANNPQNINSTYLQSQNGPSRQLVPAPISYQQAPNAQQQNYPQLQNGLPQQVNVAPINYVPDQNTQHAAPPQNYQQQPQQVTYQIAPSAPPQPIYQQNLPQVNYTQTSDTQQPSAPLQPVYSADKNNQPQQAPVNYLQGYNWPTLPPPSNYQQPQNTQQIGFAPTQENQSLDLASNPQMPNSKPDQELNNNSDVNKVINALEESLHNILKSGTKKASRRLRRRLG